MPPAAWDFDKFLGEPVVPTNHSSGTLTVALSEGSHVIAAAYVLGTDFASASSPLVQNVTAATSSMSFSSSANPSVFGQPSRSTPQCRAHAQVLSQARFN